MYTISLSEALRLMAEMDSNGKPVKFNLEVRTFNLQTKKGGKLKTYLGAEMLRKPQERNSLLTKESVFEVQHNPKNHNHWKNRTRNIKVDGKVKKINIDYIISLNGQKVHY